MKRATRGLLSFVTAFLIVSSTFGNAFLVAEASEPTAIEQTVVAADSASTEMSTADAATDNASGGSSTVATDAANEDDTSEDANENHGENDAQNTSDDAAGTADTANSANTASIADTANSANTADTTDVAGTAGTQTVSENNADAGAAETATEESVNLVVNATLEDGYVTLTCDVEGSTIYYSINEAGDAGYTIYDDRISIDTTQDTVIWAYASYDSDTMDAVDGERVKFEFPATEAADEFALMRASKGADDNGKKADSLSAGDMVIIAVGNRAITKNTASNKKLDSVEITVADGAASSYDGAAVFTVEASGDYFAFKNDEGKYLATPSATSQGLVFADSLSSDDADCGKWVLENADSGHFNVRSNTVLSNNNKYQYLSCKNNSFSVLTNNASNKNLCHVDFYLVGKASSVAAPTASVESGAKVEFGAKVELSCATEGATIKYSFDGENYETYEEAVEITDDVTLSAYAELDGVAGNTAEFKYELFAGSRITDVTKLTEDQKFVITFGGDKAMSVTASKADKNGNTKLEPATVAIDEDGHLTYSDEGALFAMLSLVKAETGGQYYITSEFPAAENDDQTTATEIKYLTTGATGNSLTFETEKNDYSLWSFELEEDGSFLVKNVNAVYHDNRNNIDKPQYFEFYNNLFTAYSYLAGTDSKDAFTFAAYTLPEFVEGEPEVIETKLGVKVTDISKLYNGAEFSLAYNDEKILSAKASGTKIADDEAKFDDDHNLIYSESFATLKLVEADAEGEYYIVSGSKYLTCPASGNGLSFVDSKDDYSIWTIEDQGEGAIYIKNAKAAHSNKPQYVEFYNGFTTYGFNESKKAIYTFTAYSYTDGEPVDEKGGVKFTDLTKLYDGQKFVLTFNNEKALSTTANGKKLNGEDVKLNEEGRLSYTDESAAIATLKLAKGEAEGQYYIVSEIKDGDSVTTKYLTTGETGNSLSFETEKNEYSLWTFESEDDGSFMVKSVNAVYKEKAQYLEFYKDLFTAYSYTAGGAKDAYLFTAYSFPELEGKQEEPVNTVAKLLKREFNAGDQVVAYHPTSGKVMSSTAENGGLKGIDLKPSEEGLLDIKDTDAIVLTVSVDDNGNYVFKTEDGKFLSIVKETKTQADGKTKDYINLVLTDEAVEGSTWVESAADENNAGNFYLKSTTMKVGSSVQAFEYYNGDFKAYGFKEDPAYIFNFYAVKEGESTAKLEYDTDTSLAVAQWAGNAHYDETENSEEYINGDLYATNDMLDKNAKFTAVVGGNASKPWTSAKSTTTGSTSFYMGSTGVISESDYMELSFPSNGYGNMSLALRMRASNTAAGAFQLQYSTDGENFKNLKNGTYSYKYTAYKKTGETDENGKAITEPFEVSGSGDITDGIARTSLAPTYYVTFTFEIPNAAADAENVLIRLVPTGGLSAKGDKEPQKGGVIRMDSVKVTGNPVVDSSVTALVKADPASGEIGLNQEIVLSTATEGAEIYYSVNGDEFVKYEDGAKIKFTELPATISTYAVKEGLKKSITVNYQYTQAQVAAVKANPNGGAVFADQYVSFKTATEGAIILYRFRTAEEIAKDADTEAEKKTDETTDAAGTATSNAAVDTSTDESTADKPVTEGEETEPAEEEQHDDWKQCSGSIKLENLPCEIQVKAVLEGYKDSPVSTLKFTKRLNDKYNVYFGQVHAHTNISDGAGSLADALEHASHVDNLDYIVITDHSNSIDNEKESKITENVDKSENDEWTYAHNLVKQYSTDDFTCAYGYEMTWSNGLGHINTYNTPGFQSRTQTEYSTYATALQNYYAALRTVPDSISQFNHPGTTFGDFSDFAYYSEENDALITMIEVGNGEGTIGSSGYFPSYEYYTRALDKGWHVAPTNNQDNHKGKWGDANTARTVMLADTNDEDAIYDAMRNYRIYATEDNDLYIYYTLEGNIMGSILDKDAVGDHLAIKADIKDPTDGAIGKVEVIVNGGRSIADKTVDESESTVEFTVPSNYSYYYLKITQKDGNIAVTAPVWVGSVEACGINSTYTKTVLPVAGEPFDINVDLYNNEDKDLVINDIEIQLSDVDGNKTPVAKVTGEEAEITSVSPKGTATYKTEFVYNQAGKVTYEVTVNAVLGGVEKTYTDKLTVDYTVPEMVADVLIDGTHYNDYVTGYYGGNMSAFISICASRNIRAQVVTTEITPESLNNCALLVLSAPAKKNGTANAGNYSVSHYSDEFIAMVKDYVANGGSVIVCGLADYSDTADGQTATEQNKLLEAIGSTIRMGSDEVCDDEKNGGQVYRMYPTTYNVDEAAGLFAGLRDGQQYSQYSGCSVDISNATATDFVDAAKWLVKGYDTTYSVNCKDDASGKALEGALPNGVKGIKNDNDGNVTFLATQHTKAGGDIYVAGGVFISDFEVKAEIDNADSLPFTNYTIINNILGGYTVELPISTIAQARAGEMNQVFAVEGYVTSGTSNPDTTFFDTIYIQDETAGIDIFPYATAGLEIGTKVRITGFVAQYQGDMELKVISSKILDDEPYVWEPKVVDTRAAMDYAAFGGSLLKTSGKVTRVAEGADGNIEEFWLADDTGVEAAIFIDGYIKSGTTGDEGKAALNDFVKVGAEVSAIGVLYMHPEGDSDVSVPVFRVRNCDDIVLIHEAAEPTPGTGSGSASGSESGTESGQGSESGSGTGTGSESGTGSEPGTGSESGTGIEPGSGSGSSSETGTESGSGSSDNGGNSGSSSSGETAPQSPIQRVLGAIKQTVESVINTVTDGAKNLVNRIFGRSNKNKTTTTTSTDTSEGEVVGSVTDITEDQTALAETPEQPSGDQPAITEQTGDNKTDTIVEEATATSDKPESKARKAAKAAAATVVVTSGLGLAAIGIRKLLLLLHVIK